VDRLTVKAASLTLQFLLELGVLAALGYWGFTAVDGSIARIALGVGGPLLAVAAWAAFGSPKARWHLVGVWRLVLQLLFFGSAALALAAAGHPVLAVVFAVVTACNIALLHALGEERFRDSRR